MALLSPTIKRNKPLLEKKGLLIAIAIGVFLAHAGTAGAAGLSPVTISANILTNSNCRLSLKASTIPFGNLDPAFPVPVVASTTIDFRCLGAAGMAVFTITQDGGLNPLGADNQMENLAVPGEFLRYNMTLVHIPPPIVKNVWNTLTINGTVLGPDYQAVLPGIYEDTVVVTILP